MIYHLKLYALTFIAFFAMDMLWLGVLGRSFYQKHLGFLMASRVNWPAAIAFYLLFVAGLLFFVVLPGLEKNSLGVTCVRAALFGLITYATYDLTNLATLKDWPLLLSLVDITWGIILSVTTSAVSFLAGQRLG